MISSIFRRGGTGQKPQTQTMKVAICTCIARLGPGAKLNLNSEADMEAVLSAPCETILEFIVQMY
jgi:hypothetical protein